MGLEYIGYLLGKIIYNAGVTLLNLGTIVCRAGQLVTRFRDIVVIAVRCSGILDPKFELGQLASRDICEIMSHRNREMFFCRIAPRVCRLFGRECPMAATADNVDRTEKRILF